MMGTKMRLMGKLTKKLTVKENSQPHQNYALYPVIIKVNTSDMKKDIVTEIKTENIRK